MITVTAAFQGRRSDDAELEEDEHRDPLEQCGHGVGAWEAERERGDRDDRAAPVFAYQSHPQLGYVREEREASFVADRSGYRVLVTGAWVA